MQLLLDGNARLGDRRGFRRARASARWSVEQLAGVVDAVLRGTPGRLWSADDVRERLAFGQEGGGPPATSVRQALRLLVDRGDAERIEVWGRRGWGGTVHAYRARAVGRERGPVAA